MSKHSNDRIPFVDLAKQFSSIKNDVMPAIRSVAEEAAFIRGPALTDFEERFAGLHNTKHAIGDDCFIAHGVMFVNDLFRNAAPARERPELWRPTNIGDNVCIGSNATILPVSICDDVVVGAGAVVTKDISAPGIYMGNPARKSASSRRASPT